MCCDMGPGIECGYLYSGNEWETLRPMAFERNGGYPNVPKILVHLECNEGNTANVRSPIGEQRDAELSLLRLVIGCHQTRFGTPSVGRQVDIKLRMHVPWCQQFSRHVEAVKARPH
jgi:hypothetical protein